MTGISIHLLSDSILYYTKQARYDNSKQELLIQFQQLISIRQIFVAHISERGLTPLLKLSLLSITPRF